MRRSGAPGYAPPERSAGAGWGTAAAIAQPSLRERAVAPIPQYTAPETTAAGAYQQKEWGRTVASATPAPPSPRHRSWNKAAVVAAAKRALPFNHAPQSRLRFPELRRDRQRTVSAVGRRRQQVAGGQNRCNRQLGVATNSRTLAPESCGLTGKPAPSGQLAAVVRRQRRRWWRRGCLRRVTRRRWGSARRRFPSGRGADQWIAFHGVRAGADDIYRGFRRRVHRRGQDQHAGPVGEDAADAVAPADGVCADHPAALLSAQQLDQFRTTTEPVQLPQAGPGSPHFWQPVLCARQAGAAGQGGAAAAVQDAGAARGVRAERCHTGVGAVGRGGVAAAGQKGADQRPGGVATTAGGVGATTTFQRATHSPAGDECGPADQVPVPDVSVVVATAGCTGGAAQAQAPHACGCVERIATVEPGIQGRQQSRRRRRVGAVDADAGGTTQHIGFDGDDSASVGAVADGQSDIAGQRVRDRCGDRAGAGATRHSLHADTAAAIGGRRGVGEQRPREEPCDGSPIGHNHTTAESLLPPPPPPSRVTAPHTDTAAAGDAPSDDHRIGLSPSPSSPMMEPTASPSDDFNLEDYLNLDELLDADHGDALQLPSGADADFIAEEVRKMLGQEAEASDPGEG
eukprot:ctg_193.g89